MLFVVPRPAGSPVARCSPPVPAAPAVPARQPAGLAAARRLGSAAPPLQAEVEAAQIPQDGRQVGAKVAREGKARGERNNDSLGSGAAHGLR